MVWLGVAITAAAALSLFAAYWRSTKAEPYSAYGWIDLSIIAAAEMALSLEVKPVAVYFTPIVWTGYIMAIDAAVFSLRGRSLLRTEPQAFVWMAILSIFLWFVFEGYNMRLRNWTYVGLPRNFVARYVGYGWSFATIWPALLETTEFLLATCFRGMSSAPEPPVPRKTTGPWIVVGLAMVTIPLLVPLDWGVYLFGSVWVGFILLIDPLNYRARRPSVWGDISEGSWGRLWALMLAGGICGIFWEFWNYWAEGKWFYIFPILEQWTIFEMPVVGYLGFPVFAVEVFALYVFVVSWLKLPFYEPR